MRGFPCRGGLSEHLERLWAGGIRYHVTNLHADVAVRTDGGSRGEIERVATVGLGWGRDLTTARYLSTVKVGCSVAAVDGIGVSRP